MADRSKKSKMEKKSKKDKNAEDTENVDTSLDANSVDSNRAQEMKSSSTANDLHQGDDSEQVDDSLEADGFQPADGSQQAEGFQPAEGSPLEKEENGSPTYEDLQVSLQKAEAKTAQHWEQVLRAKAELDNLRRRSEKQVEKAHKYALNSFAEELLPVKDSLELGLAASAGDDIEADKLREGSELTLKMLQACMEKFGITQINPLNEVFNPELHQAMSIQNAPDKEPNTVLMVFQKGYLLNDRLIRPARVVVSTRDGKQLSVAAEGKIANTNIANTNDNHQKGTGTESDLGNNIDKQA